MSELALDLYNALSEIGKLRKRIAELEAEIDQLTADSTDERKDDKLPEREVCEACGGDGTLLLTDGYEGQVMATAKCIYCNGTGRVNKECEE
jgi:DnaJ-class molecular chaperone